MSKEPKSSEVSSIGGRVTIGNVMGGIHNSIIAGRDIAVQMFTGSDITWHQAQRNRQALLKLVNNFWIKGVLEKSLHGAVMLQLGLQEQNSAVDRPWDMVLHIQDRPDQLLPPDTRIVDVFDEGGQALLILGEPGSGKTTMLLELAQDLIQRAEDDPMRQIPVILNLSSWAEMRPSFEGWLVEELNTKYSVSRKVAGAWVNQDDLLLLLDGLDEVPLKYRETCVIAINHFRQVHSMPLVICSRLADYEALSTRLKLRQAVLLQPLRPEQIDQYLAGTGIELLAVRKMLTHDAPLQELAKSPLMLSVMTLAYRGVPIDKLRPLYTVEARRKHLFGTYVRRMFGRRPSTRLYPYEMMLHWLTWLARTLSKHSQSMLLVEQMQPSWLETPTQQWRYAITLGLIFGLVFELVLGFSGGLLFELPGGLNIGLPVRLNIGLIAGLGIGLLGGLIYGVLDGLRDNNINPIERLTWSRKKALYSLKVGILFGLGCYAFILNLLGVGWVLFYAGLDILFMVIFGISGVLIYGPVFGIPLALFFRWIATERGSSENGRRGKRRTIKTSIGVGLLGGVLGGLNGTLLATIGVFGRSMRLSELFKNLIFVVTYPDTFLITIFAVSGLGTGLVAGLTYMVMSKQNDIYVKPLHKFFSWSAKNSIKILSFSLIFGMSVIIITGLFTGGFEEYLIPLFINSSPVIVGSVVMVGLLFYGFLFGLIFGPLFWLIGGLTRVEVETKIAVNQGIRRSIKNATFFGLAGGIFSGLVGYLVVGFSQAQHIAVIGGLICAFLVGGKAVLQHYSLRFLLFLNRNIPWQLGKVLDYSTERILLRKVGGGYIFIHRLLMEHLAKEEITVPHIAASRSFLNPSYLWFLGVVVFTGSLLALPGIGGFVYYNTSTQLEDLLFQGNSDLNEGRYGQAATTFTKIIKSRPGDATAYYYRGRAYEVQEQYTQAIADFTSAIELETNYVSVYYHLGYAYYEQGEYEQAIANYSSAIALYQDYDAAYTGRGVAYFFQHDYYLAIADFSKAIELNPNVAVFYHLRGIAYISTNDPRLAINDLQEYLRLAPDAENREYIIELMDELKSEIGN